MDRFFNFFDSILRFGEVKNLSAALDSDMQLLHLSMH